MSDYNGSDAARHPEPFRCEYEFHTKPGSPDWMRYVELAFVSRFFRVVQRLSKAFIDKIDAGCQSPIEKQLAAHICGLAALQVPECAFVFESGMPSGATKPMTFTEFKERIASDIEFHLGDRRYSMALGSQILINNYRVDFVIRQGKHFDNESGRVWWVVIECDGHEFHERTKEQAARDRKRDRDLQKEGFLVFRFTGSEIMRDASACAEEVFRALGAAMRGAAGLAG